MARHYLDAISESDFIGDGFDDDDVVRILAEIYSEPENEEEELDGEEDRTSARD